MHSTLEGESVHFDTVRPVGGARFGTGTLAVLGEGEEPPEGDRVGSGPRAMGVDAPFGGGVAMFLRHEQAMRFLPVTSEGDSPSTGFLEGTSTVLIP